LIQESAKLGWLMENLPQMLEEGRRVLLFSQFTSMLDLIGRSLDDAGITWTTLTGQTRDREAAIARFTSGQVPVFLISLKAGGTGLNLPQADTVIHYDPWWNPAAEAQATDRAHRMGQTQTVFVYKLVAEGTVEERIVAMQSHKAELARGVQAAGRLDEERRTSLSENDLDWLLQPLGAAAAADDEALVREAQAHAIAPRPSSSHLLEIGEAESLTEALAEEGV
jgi:SNF2 family DNA or RNA helicase